MNGIVLVSHSRKITDGLQEMIQEMTNNEVKIFSAGGTDDGRLGTSAPLIMEGIEACQDCTRILVFCDLGSSVLSAETAIGLVDEELGQKCIIMDCPLVEGAFIAAVQSMVSGDDINKIVQEVNKLTEHPMALPE